THGLFAGERALPTDQGIVRLPGAFLAVTRLTFLGVHDNPLFWRAVPGGQSEAIRRDTDVPPGDLGWGGRAAKVGGLLGHTRHGGGHSQEHQHDGGHVTRRHFSPPPWSLPATPGWHCSERWRSCHAR